MIARAARAISLAGVLVFTLAIPVLGHVGLDPGEIRDGSGSTLSFRIGHGCDGEPTDTVSVRMPPGVASVRPFPKPGWELDVERGTLPQPIVSGDQQITEGVTQVTWSGGSLEDLHTDVFQIRATVYGDEGDRVFFPVVQRCGSLEHAWIEIPTDGSDGHGLDEPAPSLVIAGDTDGGPSSGANTQSNVAIALSVTALALGAAALAMGRDDKADDEG